MCVAVYVVFAYNVIRTIDTVLCTVSIGNWNFLHVLLLMYGDANNFQSGARGGVGVRRPYIEWKGDGGVTEEVIRDIFNINQNHVTMEKKLKRKEKTSSTSNNDNYKLNKNTQQIRSAS